MTSLALNTTFPSSAHQFDQDGGFSVLPSPSTFGLSSHYSAYTNDYQAYDYSLPLPTTSAHSPASSNSDVPSLLHDSPRSSSSSSSTSSSEHGASSPASSFRLSPTVSPNAVKLELPGDEFKPFESASQHKLFSSADDFAAPLPLGDIKGNSLSASFAATVAGCEDNNDAMYAPQQQQQQQVQLGGYPSSSTSLNGTTVDALGNAAAMSAAGLVAQQQHQPVYAQPPQVQQQRAAYYDLSSSSSAASFNGAPVYMAPSSHSLDLQQQQHQAQVVYAQQPVQQQAVYQPVPQVQQQATPLQLVTLNGVTYAMPVASAAPAPAAIETPHGTYYFVPTAPALAPVAVDQQPQQAPFVVASGLPAPVAATIPGLSPLSSGPSPTLSASSTTTSPVASSTSASISSLPPGVQPISSVPALKPTPLDPQQKIRLPVGQGKRGSTKRTPAKKDQVKRFVCPFQGCGRGFARNFNMQSHYASHLGVRNFDCPHCPKKFSRRHDRARHCAAVHDSHVDRDGNILGADGASASVSASASPSSSSHSHDQDAEGEGEHDELDQGVANHDFGFDTFGIDSTYSVDQQQFATIGGGSA